MPASSLQTIFSRSGHPNVEIGGVAYHSLYNPVREAQKFYGAFPIEKADVILHFGWGLGYAGQFLRERIRASSRVVIFEPDEKLFRHSLTQVDNHVVLQDSRFQFVIGDGVCRFFDASGLDKCQDTDEILWISWPAAARLHAETLESLMAAFKFRLRDRAANLLTHFENGATYFQNVLSNIDYLADPDAGRLFGRFAGVPLVVVSAGPSLDRNIQELRGMEHRCFLLAVDTALRPLLSAGITPHAVIMADPTELNARHITGAMPESTYLIAEQAVHVSALRASSRRFLFGLGLFPDSLFAKFEIARSRLQVWGSVATAALDLATRMEANPIIFAGQDFAYSWDANYASHTIFDGNRFDVAARQTSKVRDVWGRTVRSTENLIAYRDFFVRRIRQAPNVRFINATEGGILDGGVEILSLKHALHQCCNRRLDIQRMIEDAWSGGPPAPAGVDKAIEHLAEVLRNRSRDCGCLESFLELTAKESLLKKDKAASDQAIVEGLAGCERLLHDQLLLS